MADVSRDRGRDARPESGDCDDCAEHSRRTGWPESGDRDDRTRRDGDQRHADRNARDRGQLILVTGLAVAVTLVALVLLLNTVIYTQNLATRGTGIEDGEAVGFRGEVVEGVGDVLDAENRQEYDSYDDLHRNVSEGVAQYDVLASRYYAESATVADIEEDTLSTTNGTILYQTNASRNFTNSTGTSADWTLAEDVSNARNFQLTVSAENLSNDDDGAFSVRLANETDTWRIYVYNDGGDVAVTNATDDSTLEDCTTSRSEATIDLAAGTVAGFDCPELAYPTEMDPYDVTFRNGDQATGTYAVTIGHTTDDSNIESDNFAEPGDEESPRAVPAVYATEFDVHFQTTDLEFHTRLRVAPGEPE
jgi:hypothetical protein